MPAHRLLCSAAIGLTLWGWFSQGPWQGWLLDLASSFQIQYAIANLCLGVWLLGLYLKHQTRARAASLLLSLVCISFQVALLGSWYRPAIAPSSALPSGLPLKLLSVNIHPGLQDYGPLLNLVEEEGPDLVLLQEATALSLQQFRSFAGLLPYSLNKIPTGDRRPGEKYPPKGTALFSRFPLTEISSTPNSPVDRAGLLAQVQTVEDASRSWLQVFVIHGIVPIRPSNYRQRNAQIKAAFAAVQTAALPAVVMGDFNTALWSDQLSPASAQPLRPARSGSGLLPTWRPNLDLPPGLQWLSNLFWVPIDHSYVSPDIAIRAFRLGPDVKSDHLPIIAELSVAATSARDDSDEIEKLKITSFEHKKIPDLGEPGSTVRERKTQADQN